MSRSKLTWKWNKKKIKVRLTNEKHHVFTKEVNKIVLSVNDDKTVHKKHIKYMYNRWKW